MAKKASARRGNALNEIVELRSEQRKCILKGALAIAAILIAVAAKVALETNGLIESGNILVGSVMMVITVGLAIVGGSASISYTKSSHAIANLQARVNISKDDIKQYEKSRKRS